jgi:predicted transcriptional regulator
MLTFACKKINIEDIIRCSLELNKTEYKTLFFLLGASKNYSVNDIAKEIGLTRTTIQKAIKKMADNNLIKRTQINLNKGGYEFYYNIKDRTDLKSKIKQILWEWSTKAEKEIDQI